MIDVEDITTTIFYYNKDYEKKFITDFEFLSTFRYGGYDIYVLKFNNLYKLSKMIKCGRMYVPE